MDDRGKLSGAIGEISQLEAFSAAMHEAMANDDRLMILTADLRVSCKLSSLFNTFPERCVDVGIAEQNLVGFSAGLALEGMKPFAVTFACFASMRACEQYRTSVLYQGLNVKLVGTHSGVSHSQSGSTHFSLEDVGIMRSMPTNTVVIPSDAASAEALTLQLAEYDGPAYLRLDRNPLPPIYTAPANAPASAGEDGRKPPQLLSIAVLRSGEGLALIGTGSMTSVAFMAASILSSEDGIEAAVVDIPTIKPLDGDALSDVITACQVKTLVTVEEHNVIGGLGSAVAEEVAERALGVRLIRLGVNDVFPNGAPAGSMWSSLGLTPKAVALSARKAISSGASSN